MPLGVQQRGHQQRVQRRATGGGLELRTPGLGEGRPVDQRSQLHQLMTLVDQVDQFRQEQVLLGGINTGGVLNSVCEAVY